jgi:hypothetical protein
MLISLPSSAAEETQATTPHSPESLCRLLSGIGGLNSRTLQDAPSECAEVLRCLLEVGVLPENPESDASVEPVQTICEAVDGLAGMTGDQVREFLSRLPETSPSECKAFLICVADVKQGSPDSSEQPVLRGQPEWKSEFDRICSQVPIAESLSIAQLRQLIEDTDTLSTALEASTLPEAKVFIRRLDMCRSFFEYVIEILTQEPDGPEGDQDL